MSLQEFIQTEIDREFVSIVAFFVQLDALADRIIAANGGWED